MYPGLCLGITESVPDRTSYLQVSTLQEELYPHSPGYSSTLSSIAIQHQSTEYVNEDDLLGDEPLESTRIESPEMSKLTTLPSEPSSPNISSVMDTTVSEDIYSHADSESENGKLRILVHLA